MLRAPFIVPLVLSLLLAGCVTPPAYDVTGRAENVGLRFSVTPYAPPKALLAK